MNIYSPVLGDVGIEESQIISFEKGLPGFEQEKNFVFMELGETPFTIMQSLDSDLYFFVIRPFDFFKDYQLDLPDSIVEFLQIHNPEDLAIYNITTIKEDIAQITANMQAPIVVNAKAQKGKQVVLPETKYLIRQPLFNHPKTASTK